jgi:hypothetical protein
VVCAPPSPTVTVITIPVVNGPCVDVLNPPAPPPPPVELGPPAETLSPPLPPPATTKKSIEYGGIATSLVTSSSTVGIQPCVAPE